MRRRRHQPITADQARQVLAAVDTHDGLTPKQLEYCMTQSARDKAILSLIMAAGISAAECAGLDTADIDMYRSTVTVSRRNAKMSMPFSEETAAHLQSWLEQRVLIRKEPDAQDAVFLSSRRKRMTVRNIEILVAKYVERADLDPSVTSKKLRGAAQTHDGAATKGR